MTAFPLSTNTPPIELLAVAVGPTTEKPRDPADAAGPDDAGRVGQVVEVRHGWGGRRVCVRGGERGRLIARPQKTHEVTKKNETKNSRKRG